MFNHYLHTTRTSTTSAYRFHKISLFLALTLLLSALVSACGDATATPVPITTAIATPTNPATATTAATTTAPPGDRNSFFSMLATLPDNGNMGTLFYNNYASTYRIYDLHFSSTEEFLKSKNSADLTGALRNMTASAVSGAVNLNQNIVAPLGWDFFQVESDIRQGDLPYTLYVLRGHFSPSNIDSSLTSLNYKKENLEGNTLYNVRPDGKRPEDVTAPTAQLLSYINNIGLSADGSTIITGAYNQEAKSALPLAAGSDNTTKSLAQNPGMKAIAEAFGPVQMAIVSDKPSDYKSSNLGLKGSDLTQPDGTPKFPTPQLLAVAYTEQTRGDIYYLLADYYDSPAKANAAQPVIEDLLKTGNSFASKQPYSTYFTLVSSEVKGNLVLYRVKPVGTKPAPIHQFIYTRDLPVMFGNE